MHDRGVLYHTCTFHLVGERSSVYGPLALNEPKINLILLGQLRGNKSFKMWPATNDRWEDYVLYLKPHRVKIKE